MPYTNLPEDQWGKMDSCVEKVQGQGHDKESAIRICYRSLTGKSLAGETVEEFEIATKALNNSVRSLIEGKIHRAYTVACDDLLLRGYLSHDERMAIGGLVGDLLSKFGAELDEKVATREVPSSDVDEIVNSKSAAKAGARHNKTDKQMIQEMHDHACKLGAKCPMSDMEEDKSAPLEDDNPESVRFAPPTLAYIKSLRLPHNEQWLRDVAAVKAVGQDDIRGYLALWGDPEQVDLEREFFTRQTDFWDKTLALPKPLTWDHGLDRQTKAAPVIGRIAEMGDDDVGRWYVAQLDRSHRFRKAIDKLISQRAVGTSSDSAPQYVVREPVKSGAVWLKQWPLFAAALTATPCEPRMLEAGSPYWKALGVELPAAPDGAASDEAPAIAIPQELIELSLAIKRKVGLMIP